MGVRRYRGVIARLALAALLLRALIPAGFMPRPALSAADAHLIICTGEGARLIFGDQDTAPSKTPIAHKPCIFAPVSPLAEAPQIQPVASARLEFQAVLFSAITAPSTHVLSFDHAARAPPRFS